MFSFLKLLITKFHKIKEKQSKRQINSGVSSQPEDTAKSNNPSIPDESVISKDSKEKRDRLEKTSKHISSIRSIVLDLIIVLVIFVIGLLIYKELNKESVIIEPFQVPLELERQNITGQAIVNKLIDQIEIIKENADTNYQGLDFKPILFDSQLEIVIPGSGISLKSLLQNVKNFLGRKQTRITGEVVLNNKQLHLTIRVFGEPSKTFSGELDDLDEILKNASRYVLKYTQPYVLAYDLYYNYQNHKEEALEMIQYTLSHDPKDDDPMAYTLDGYIKWDEKNFDESIKLYKKAIELNPKYTDAYNGWGYSLYDEKKYNEASEIYKKALLIDPKNKYTFHYMGLNLEAQDKTDSAVEMYRKSIMSDPSYPDVYSDFGRILAKMNKNDEAEKMFEKQISLLPKSPAAYSDIAEFYYGLKDYDKALENFNKAIELNPDFVKAITGAADVLSDQNKTWEANKLYRKAITIDPERIESYKNLGNNLEKENKSDSAAGIYRLALKSIYTDSLYFNRKLEDLKISLTNKKAE